MRNNNLKMLVASAVGASLTAVLAQFTIPFPYVPNTAQPLAIGLLGTILGKKYGTIAALLYVLMGAIGLPVFAGMSGGWGIIMGPTGGYIWMFPVAAFLIGWITETFGDGPIKTSIANIIATFLIITVGTIRLQGVADIPLEAAIASGFMPFVITNPIQALAAGFIGRKVNHAMRAAGVLGRRKAA